MDSESQKLFFDGSCPACGSEPYVDKTKNPVQIMKCPNCEIRWQVIKVNMLFEDAMSKAAEEDRWARYIKSKRNFLLKDR